MLKVQTKLGCIVALTLSCIVLPSTANATIITMDTSLGNIEIQLFDQTAPQTVANFLNYATSGAYDNSIFHRDIPGFVLQGGGFTWNGPSEAITPGVLPVTQPVQIPTNAAIPNEFNAANSNVTGTIAMAQLGGDPNSATDEWFFNLTNNNTTANGGTNLDAEKFTVFGQVIGNGMQIVDEIAALHAYDLYHLGYISSGAFTSTPLLPNQDMTYSFVTINNIVVNSTSSAVPLPTSAWMFATGLAAIAVRSKAKNRTLSAS